MKAQLGRSLLRELRVIGIALVLVVIYLAVATNGFTARPDWLGAWNAAKLEAIR